MSLLVTLAADGLVAVLLVATIVSSIKLSRRIAQLKGDEAALRQTIGDLMVATSTAERAIAGLRSTLDECDRTLAERLGTAERYAADIAAQVEAGEGVIARIGAIVTQMRGAAPRPVAPEPAVQRPLALLRAIGLGYLRLGQPATELSGGEAQRIKLSKELSRRATGRTLYILDEPTTGLHFEDVKKLLEVLHQLVATGNTVVVIEHNLEVIKTADWILDLGPEGGDGGGRIVAEGTPEEVAKVAGSHTGRFLAPLLPVRDAKPAPKRVRKAG